ncbi:MAG: hypothetical protein WCJ56_15155 [bacterium]
MRNLMIVVGVILAIGLVGCGSKPVAPERKNEVKTSASATNASPASTINPAKGEFIIQDGAGNTIFKNIWWNDRLSTKAIDGYGKFIGIVEYWQIEGNFVQFTDNEKSDNGHKMGVTGKIIANGTTFYLEDASGKKIAKIEARDGGYRIKDTSGKYLAKLKPEGSDCKIANEVGDKIGKAKLKGDKILVEDAKGDTKYQIYGIKNVQAAAVWLLDGWTPLQKAAVMLALNK